MGDLEISYKGQSFPKNEFVEELIYENIGLLEENKQLEHEIKILKRRMQLLESLDKKYGMNAIVKKAQNCVVILVSRTRSN